MNLLLPQWYFCLLKYFFLEHHPFTDNSHQDPIAVVALYPLNPMTSRIFFFKKMFYLICMCMCRVCFHVPHVPISSEVIEGIGSPGTCSSCELHTVACFNLEEAAIPHFTLSLTLMPILHYLLWCPLSLEGVEIMLRYLVLFFFFNLWLNTGLQRYGNDHLF